MSQFFLKALEFRFTHRCLVSLRKSNSDTGNPMPCTRTEASTQIDALKPEIESNQIRSYLMDVAFDHESRCCGIHGHLWSSSDSWFDPIKKIQGRGAIDMENFLAETEEQTHRQRYGKDNFRSKFNRSSARAGLITSLGLLGVFNGYNLDKLEEQKEKLTNEEKNKKMTPFERIIAKGVLNLCDLEYDKAEVLFHQALHLAQKDHNEEQVTLVLNLLATNYFDSGQLDKAEKLFIDLIQRLLAKDLQLTDPAILELSLKLSSIYSNKPDHEEKAQKGFEFVISNLLYILKDILRDLDSVQGIDLSHQQRNDLALLGWAYDSFARHLMYVNDFEGAVELLKRALEISVKVLGPLHDQTLILLNDVGTTLAMINKPREGQDFIKRAVKGAIQSQSPELASFYVNLGLINLQLKELMEAKRYCEYSSELASKDSSHHNTDEVINLSQNCLAEVNRMIQLQSPQ